MARHRVGSAVVQDNEQLAGILTERDVLRAVAAGVDPDRADVGGVVTRDVVAAGTAWAGAEAPAPRAEHRVRPLVVYEGGHLLGVLSVRDVLPALLPARSTGDGERPAPGRGPVYSQWLSWRR